MALPQAAFAQISLNVTAPSSVTAGNNITYSINLINSTPAGVQNVTVTSSFSPSLQFVSATTNANVQTTVQPARVQFTILNFPANGNIALSLVLRAPSTTGTVTNLFTVNAFNFSTNRNVSTTVNAASSTADASVTISVPTTSIFVDDWVAYTINVTNRSGNISDLFLTNTVPTSAFVRGYSPSNRVTLSGNRLIFNIGTLGANRSTNLQVTLQPTTAGSNVLIARLRSSGSADTNTVNDSATATLNVQQQVFDQLTVMDRSEQILDRQNLLMQQLITVSNASPSNATSARVMLANIDYKVVNAVGTNDGDAFVVHAAPLAPSQTVEFLLEYFIPEREPRPFPNFIAYSAGNIDLTPPAGTSVSATNKIRRPVGLLTLPNSVVEFAATPGASYQILYTTNMSSPVIKALPPLVAQANRVQWIDYGPPKTLSRPVFGEVTNTVSTTNFVMTTNTMGEVTTNENVTTVTVTNTSMRFYQAIRLP